MTNAVISTAKERLQELSARAIAELTKVLLDSMAIPRALNEDDSLHTVKSRDWTSGFHPGNSFGGFPNGFEIDVTIIYAEYYYVEALRRRVAID